MADWPARWATPAVSLVLVFTLAAAAQTPALPPEPGAVDPPGPRACLDEASLADLVACLEDWMPREGSQGYAEPDAVELAAFGNATRALLETPCRALELPSTLTLHYDVARFRDVPTGERYCVLLETRDGDGDGRVDRGWGTIAVDQDATRRIHLSIPHPLFDIDTGEQAASILPRVDGATLVVAGAHRYANAPTGDQAAPSDPAHRRDTPFHRATMAIAEQQALGPGEGVFLQLHGMASSSCPDVDVYLTDGTEQPPAEDAPLAKLQAALAAQRGWTVTVPGDEPGCHLSGTTNVQGQALNARGQRFVHVESEREDRLAEPWIGAIEASGLG